MSATKKNASVDEEEYTWWTCQRADGWCESVWNWCGMGFGASKPKRKK